MFTPTARETQIMEFLKQGNAPRSKAEIIEAFPDERSTLAAIEGCLAKHFVAQDATGQLVLTESGRKQI
ncbi:MAG: hypothetical protein K2N58_03820 [Treponemataceae bacterium]|nr:hypothetical protein [Treponemataceae bacterium]